jgi:hypothetical protein
MREIALTVEFLLQSVCGSQTYRSSTRKAKEIRTRRVSSSTPKLFKPIVGTKLEDILKKQKLDELESKKKRD